MQVGRDLVQIANGLQHVDRHIFRIVRYELDPFDTIDIVNQIQQLGERSCLAGGTKPIAVHGLPQQGYFLGTLIGQNLRFLVDLFRRPALFRSTSHRDDAVRAKFVATDLDSQKGLEGSRSHFRIAEWIESLVATFD